MRIRAVMKTDVYFGENNVSFPTRSVEHNISVMLKEMWFKVACPSYYR